MTCKFYRIFVLTLTALSLNPGIAGAENPQREFALAPNLFSSAPPTRKIVKNSPKMIPVCYDFGCRVKDFVSLTQDDWATVEVIFKPQTQSPRVERVRIGKAVAQMERLIGQYTPIHNDVGLNLTNGAEFPGQLDCIDESINTTTYLNILMRYELIRHHKVVERAYRRAIFDQHWTGQLEELETAERYVVDTWFYANGENPVIQPTHEWQDISIFTSYTNNSIQNSDTGLVKTLSQKFGTGVRNLLN